MSAASTVAQPTFTDEKTYLIARIAGDIAPTLADKPQDRAAAMQMAWRMVKAYHPASEADVTSAARIVTMSMLQLDLTREATQAELTPALKLQYTRAVVSLNRSICQAERALERRQKAEERRPPEQQPIAEERINRTSNQDAVHEAMVEQMMEEFHLMSAARQQPPPSPAADPAAASAPPHPAQAAPPSAAPVNPQATRVTRPVPPHQANPPAFAQPINAAHAQHHAALYTPTASANACTGAADSARAASPG